MRKKSADWHIAAIHYLTTGITYLVLGIPFGLLLIIFLRATGGFLPNLAHSQLLLQLTILGIRTVELGLWLLPLWIAVIYSANFLKKRYIIRDKNKIVNLSTTYQVVITVIGWVLFHIRFSFYNAVMALLITIVFYLASKEYIRKTPEETPELNPNQTKN